MRLGRAGQKGFTLVELIVGVAVILAVFAVSFRNLVGLRKGVQRVTTTGPHVHFESFAVSRLKVFFSKMMQWNAHVFPNGSSSPSDFCELAGFFGYAPNRTNLAQLFRNNYEHRKVDDPPVYKIDNRLANVTLGADLRLSLSTFRKEAIAPKGMDGDLYSLIDLAKMFNDPSECLKHPMLAGIKDKTERESVCKSPWGAMIPIHYLDEWNEANPFSRDWCVKRRPVKDSIGDEMCKAFEACTQVAGGLGGARPINQIGYQECNNSTVGNCTDIRPLKNISMCFVFAGNLFSRTDFNVDKSTGLGAIDYPAVVGLAIANARFIDNTNLRELTCSEASTEMNRSLKVNLTIYTALNVDLTDPKKQSAQKSVREITAEKLGVSIPNCTAPNRGGFSAVGDESVCIEDPTWIYECKTSCKYP